MIMSMQEIILQVGADGGDLTLFGSRTASGWQFSLSANDSSPLLLDEGDPAIQHTSSHVTMWADAMALFDTYPHWAEFYPLAVHPDFRKQVWKEVENRLHQARCDQHYLDQWRRVCEASSRSTNETALSVAAHFDQGGKPMRQTTYRGRIITYDEAIHAMERFDKELRPTFPQRQWVRYAIEYNGQKYPPKAILRLITGGVVPGGGKPTNSRFEELGFEVVMLDEIPASPPSADDPDEDAIETALSLEYDLENSLVANLGQLESGLSLYRENGHVGQQLNAGAAGRIDILAIDSSGNLVVIELKAGEADRQVCGQIQAYMGWVKENLSRKRKVRGIIVADEFTERLKYAINVVPDLVLRRYQIVFKFSDPQ